MKKRSERKGIQEHGWTWSDGAGSSYFHIETQFTITKNVEKIISPRAGDYILTRLSDGKVWLFRSLAKAKELHLAWKNQRILEPRGGDK